MAHTHIATDLHTYPLTHLFSHTFIQSSHTGEEESRTLLACLRRRWSRSLILFFLPVFVLFVTQSELKGGQSGGILIPYIHGERTHKHTHTQKHTCWSCANQHSFRVHVCVCAQMCVCLFVCACVCMCVCVCVCV